MRIFKTTKGCTRLTLQFIIILSNCIKSADESLIKNLSKLRQETTASAYYYDKSYAGIAS